MLCKQAGVTKAGIEICAPGRLSAVKVESNLIVLKFI